MALASVLDTLVMRVAEAAAVLEIRDFSIDEECNKAGGRRIRRRFCGLLKWAFVFGDGTTSLFVDRWLEKWHRWFMN